MWQHSMQGQGGHCVCLCVWTWSAHVCRALEDCELAVHEHWHEIVAVGNARVAHLLRYVLLLRGLELAIGCLLLGI